MIYIKALILQGSEVNCQLSASYTEYNSSESTF